AKRRKIINDPNAPPMRAQDKVAGPWLKHHIPDRDGGEVVRLEFGPMFSAINGHPKPEFSADKKNRPIDGILPNDVRVTTQTLLRPADAGPAPSIIGRAIDPRIHIAEGVPIEGRVGDGW